MGTSFPAVGATLVRVAVDVEGRASVSGFAVLRSEGRLPPVVLRAGSGTAQCADVDGDGLGGLARVEITFRDSRTGEVVIGIITPDDGDLSVSGVSGGTLFFPGENVSMPVKIFVLYARNGKPG